MGQTNSLANYSYQELDQRIRLTIKFNRGNWVSRYQNATLRYYLEDHPQTIIMLMPTQWPVKFPIIHFVIDYHYYTLIDHGKRYMYCLEEDKWTPILPETLSSFLTQWQQLLDEAQQISVEELNI